MICCLLLPFLFLMTPRPPRSPLFPYTTLFRSRREAPTTRRVAVRRIHRRCSSTTSARHGATARSEEHTSELQSPDKLVCRLLLEKKKNTPNTEARTNDRNQAARQQEKTQHTST